MEVAFWLLDRCQRFLFSRACSAVIGTDGVIVDKLIQRSQIAIPMSSPKLVVTSRTACSVAGHVTGH
jgi:hypothetical protein